MSDIKTIKIKWTTHRALFNYKLDNRLKTFDRAIMDLLLKEHINDKGEDK